MIKTKQSNYRALSPMCIDHSYLSCEVRMRGLALSDSCGCGSL